MFAYYLWFNKIDNNKYEDLDTIVCDREED